MIATYWTATIFVLFDWASDGLCVNLNPGDKDIVCHRIRKHGPRIGPVVQKGTTDLKCRIILSIELNGEKNCVLTILNTTRHYVHLANRNCDIENDKYFGSKLNCVVSNEPTSQRLFDTSIKFGKSKKNSSKYIVHFIKSVGNASMNSSTFNNTRYLRRSTNLDIRYWNVLICRKRIGSKKREKNNETWRGVDDVFDKPLQRDRRNILGHVNATAFPGYFLTATVIPTVTPRFTATAQKSSVTSQNLKVASQSATRCRRSMVVNRSTIFVAPTVVGTPHVGSFVATSKLTPVSPISTTMMLRNHTRFAQTNNLSATTLELNATATRRVAQPENRTTINATFIYTDRLVSVVSTRQGSALIANIGCESFTKIFSTESTYVPTKICGTPTSRGPTPDDQNSKPTKLFIGLIAGGAVFFSIIIGVAIFRLVRRYRRIQGLRKKAKHISYFNRFDCSSPWDEPDRFGGSKLSVFTLKNSKFDIDWESTQDTK